MWSKEKQKIRHKLANENTSHAKPCRPNKTAFNEKLA